MISFRQRHIWAAIVGVLLLLTCSFSTAQAQSPDTTPPTFVSATTSTDGIEVVVTFSEDIAVSSLVTDLAARYGVSEGMILKDVMSVTVDGTENVLFRSSYSGPALTLRLDGPEVREGQIVEVAYNNIFAQEPGGVLTDRSGNAVELFDFQAVENASVYGGAQNLGARPVLDRSTLTICEGDSGSYGVSLPSQPRGTLGIGLFFSPHDVAFPNREYLSFNRDNWNVPKTISAGTSVDTDDHPNWGLIYHRIDGVKSETTYEKVIRILVLEQVHEDCNTPAAGVPTISGTAQVGQRLTASTSGISDEDGLTDVSYNYQWLADDTDIDGATNSTYTVQASDAGKTVKVRVTFTDDVGREESLTSAATAVVTATVPGAPQFPAVERGGTGELVVSWEEPDSNGGSSVTGYTVQWKEATGDWDTSADVSEATTTDTSYTISSLSLGTEYSVRVIATNSVGDGPASAEVTETADAQTSQQQVRAENTPATGAPTISGSLQVGETLMADTSGIGDADGIANAKFHYQWIADDAEIAGATGSTYTLTESEEGKVIKVRVSFADDGGNDETLTSAATGAVSPTSEQEQTQEATDRPHGLSASVEDGSVVLTWNAPDDTSSVTMYRILRQRPEEGETTPLVYVAYTLSRDTGYTDTAVDPGTLYTYSVQAADFLGYVGEASAPASVRIPGTATANSAATGAPTILGMAQVGETLTANTSGISDSDGLTNATFSYQWIADDADIAGATASTYTLSYSEEGRAIKVRVTFTDDAGNDESLTSTATAAVAESTSAEPPPPPTNLTSVVNSDGSVTLSWDAPDDDSVTGYKILRRRPPMGEHSLQEFVQDTGSTSTTYTDTDVTAGIRHVYRVKAINDAGVGAWSNYVRAEP